jgi:TolB-like protein/Flp pilus assembly protein TadD/tRNA A-37 threonylcarbamoyl transferase component Bud32
MTGKTIEHYYVLEQMSTTDLSVVYKARDLKLDRLVMLKAIEVPPNDVDALTSFQKEAKAGVSLNHPNISAIFDVIDQKEGRYLIYEYLAGSSLRERIERATETGELLPIDRAIDYIIAVAQGLAEAHRHGIVHRDVCAENVIVTPTHAVKITNFGKAKMGDVPTFAAGGRALTSSFGAFVPEQLQGASVDHRCDIYGLASLLFELLTGETAFKARNAAARLHEILYNPVPSMQELRPGISNGLQRLVERGMAKKPEDRFPTMEAFIEALRAEAREGLQETEPLPEEPAVAVLPFSTLATDPVLVEFCDGLTEELSYQLQQVEGLRVAASTSAARFRGKTEDLRKIGAHLNVNLLIEGTARSAGSNVRLIVKLTDAETGYQLWSERYDRDLRKMLEAQDEVAASVTRILQAKVLGEPLVSTPPPPSTGLTGQFATAFAVPDLKLDDVLVAAKGLRDPAETMAPAIKAAEQVLQVRPDSVDALVALGYAHAVLGNSAAAEQSFLKALQLNPERTEARAGLALYVLAPRGELSSAEALIEGDPNPSLELALSLGWIYFWQGRYEETVNQCRRAFKIDSNSSDIYLLLGRTYDALGQHREALIALGRGQLMAPEDARLLAAISYTHALSGDVKEANRLADDLGAIAQKRYVSMMELALPYAGQGLAEWVDCCVEKAKETHAAALLWWKLDPAWKPFLKPA